MALQIDILAEKNHWSGDCFIVRGAGRSGTPVVFDIGQRSFACRVPSDTRVVVLSHDDSDHIGGAEKFFETQYSSASNCRSSQAELWVPYEWSWAYRALIGLHQGYSVPLSGETARIVRAHASNALVGTSRSAPAYRGDGDGSDRREQSPRQADDHGQRATLRYNVDRDGAESDVRGADRREEHVLLPGDRLVQDQSGLDEPERSRGEDQDKNAQLREPPPWPDDTSDIMGQWVRTMVADIVSTAVNDAQEGGIPLVSTRRRGQVVQRTAESAARTAPIITRALQAGWRVRFFSYTAAQYVRGFPPYMNEGIPGEFTIVNAREVQVSWTGLGNAALLLMAAGYLTVQNRRSLVALASAAGIPRALFWADSNGAFICNSIMPPRFEGLFTAPHHGSGNRAHDPVWYWMWNHAHPTGLVSTRNNRVRHLRTDFWVMSPHRRAAPFCGTDPLNARTLCWSDGTGFGHGDACAQRCFYRSCCCMACCV
jgi:hypothetical protein